MQPTTTHQLEKKDTMDNYVCMDYKTSILILISIVLNFVTLVIVMYMTKRNCAQGVRILCTFITSNISRTVYGTKFIVYHSDLYLYRMYLYYTRNEVLANDTQTEIDPNRVT